MKKILVAEDNDSNFILMTYILKKYYTYDRARNGKEAVDMVDDNTFDLVLMDIKMPVMDGLEATKAIREKHPDLPIVALTANAFDSDRHLAIEAGCNDFLSKPVGSEQCVNMIRKLIGE
ncbi:MAG: response regulator [Prevotella sp.]|jgi:CheY-like chemotaxis protein|nr:response regulator [Prevotella sp.]